MKQLIPVFVLVAGIAATVEADTYRWVDDKGVVHFTDNPDRIPSRYLKRVQEIPSSPASATTKRGGTPVAPPPRQPRPDVKDAARNLPGGFSEQEWRSRFTTLRAELKALRDGLPENREALNQLRRKRIIYQRPSDRAAYNQQMRNIERDEAHIKELEAQLSALDIEASRVNVPAGWRQ